MEKYNLIRKRRMKNLRLRVKEDGNVYVSAPYGVPENVIKDFVESRSEWIAEQRQKLAADNAVPPVTGVRNGDSILLFGEKYVISAAEKDGKTFIRDKTLCIFVNDCENAAEITEKVVEFMAESCVEICENEVKKYLDLIGYKGAPISFRYKYLKSKWGSYNAAKNIITFNIALVKLPLRFISYTAAHEVTHIYVHNHSGDFYRLGESVYRGFLKTDREMNKIRIKSLFS